MSKKKIVCSFILTAFLFFPVFADADVILLKNGASLEGQVIEEGDKTFKLKHSSGSVEEIKKEKAAVIVKERDLPMDPEEQYLKKSKTISSADAKGHYELGLFCVNNVMFDYALKEFNQAKEIDGAYINLVSKKLEYIESVKAKAAEVADKLGGDGEGPRTLIAPYSVLERDAVILFIRSLEKNDRMKFYSGYSIMGGEFKAKVKSYDKSATEEDRKNLETALFCFEIWRDSYPKEIFKRIGIEVRIKECGDALKKMKK